MNRPIVLTLLAGLLVLFGPAAAAPGTPNSPISPISMTPTTSSDTESIDAGEGSPGDTGDEASEAVDIPEDVRRAAEGIRDREAQGMVDFLSSQYLEGRGALTRGERIAASYIISELKAAGLKPGGREGSWRQTVRITEMELGEDNTLSTARARASARAGSTPSVRSTWALEGDFIPFNFSRSGELTDVPVVFAGYGVTAPEYDYDDYAGIDVRGKVVLVLRYEPDEKNPDSIFKGIKMTPHASVLAKARNASDRGAAAMLLVTGPKGRRPEERRPTNRLARWSSLIERGEYDKRPAPDPQKRIQGWDEGVTVIALQIAPEVADDLLASAGKSLAALQEKIDSTGHPASTVLDGAVASTTVSIDRETKSGSNVLALLEGSDPKVKDEVIVIGGHYDHVGWGHYGSITGSWDRIHPGADDNASGTAGVLLAAKAFAALPEAPRRSMLFAFFTAEEMGLLGSRCYTDDPVHPLAKTAAMINLDMIGRNDPNTLTLVSERHGRKLDDFVKQVNAGTLEFEINRDFGSGIDRSDQSYFTRLGVPAVALFAGVHDDYHSPADTSNKVVSEKIVRITRLAFYTAWLVADGTGMDLRVEPTAGTPAAAAAMAETARKGNQ